MSDNIFVYKLTCDNGGAPCVKGNRISLCLCKPEIRKTAKEGDWIIGMGGKSVSKLKNRLIYVMQVEKVVCGEEYYSPGGEYEDRPDCIYEWTGKEYKRRRNAQYHSAEDMEHDLGKSEEGYNKAMCLVGDRFAYFGNSEDKTPDISKIEDIYDRLPRGHKRKFPQEEYERLEKYIKWVLEEFGCGKRGEPTHYDKSKKCNRTEDDVSRFSQCK